LNLRLIIAPASLALMLTFSNTSLSPAINASTLGQRETKQTNNASWLLNKLHTSTSYLSKGLSSFKNLIHSSIKATVEYIPLPTNSKERTKLVLYTLGSLPFFIYSNAIVKELGHGLAMILVGNGFREIVIGDGAWFSIPKLSNIWGSIAIGSLNSSEYNKCTFNPGNYSNFNAITDLFIDQAGPIIASLFQYLYAWTLLKSVSFNKAIKACSVGKCIFLKEILRRLIFGEQFRMYRNFF